MASYPKGPQNKVNRYPARGAYDFSTIHDIIDATPVLHVSFVPINSDEDPFPAILPMLGCTGNFEDPESDVAQEPQQLYLHGYVSSRLMRAGSSEGTRVAVAASLMDGIVLSLTPNHNSCNYRSAVVYGRARIVEEEQEKLYAMERINDNMIPDRWRNSRVPPTKIEMQTTAILRVDIESASAKVRVGETGEDRNDLKNEAVTSTVWTGVVPSWIQYGDPIPASTNKVANVPVYIKEWVKNNNDEGHKKAVDAVALGSK